MARKPNVSDLMADDLTSHTLDLARVSSNTSKVILGQLKTLEQDLIQKISSIGIDSEPSSIARLARLNKLKVQTAQTIKTAYSVNRTVLDNDLVSLAKLETKAALTAINAPLKVELASVALTPQVATALAKKTIIQGAPAAEWWSRQSTTLQKSFNDQMTQGILAGESTGALTQRIRGIATGKRIRLPVNGKLKSFREFSGGIMNTSTREAQALVRTSVQSVMNEARFTTYQENSDIIKEVQALVVLDSRTTSIDQARSGNIWNLATGIQVGGGENFPGPPPWHFNCRATLVPITKSFEELAKEAEDGNPKLAKKLGEVPKGTQSSMDGQVAADLNYEKWLKTKPKSFQKEVLGAGKFKLFEKGKLKLTDLISAQTGKPLTVAQLQLKQEPGSTNKIPKAPAPLKPFRAPGTPAEQLKEIKGIEKSLDAAKVNGVPSAEDIGDLMAFEISDTALGKKLLALENDLDVIELSKVIPMDSKSKASITSKMFEKVMDSWNSSSTSFSSSFLQVAIKQEFGLATATTTHLELSPVWKKAAKVAVENKPAMRGMRKMARVIYEDTQEFLKAQNIQDVYAFRGMTFRRLPTVVSKNIKDLGGVAGQPVGDFIAKSQPLSSWSSDVLTARGFASRPSGAVTAPEGALLATKIPRSRVFSTYKNAIGEAGEQELVVLGGEDKVRALYLERKTSFGIRDRDPITLKLLKE